MRLCTKCKKPVKKLSGSNYMCEEHRLEHHKAWRTKNREKVALATRNWTQRVKRASLAAYSGNPPYCVCCGEKEMVFLTLDHINNDGKQHREQIRTYATAQWVRKNGYPPGFQTLCFNCNCGRAKTPDKICPHKKVRSTEEKEVCCKNCIDYQSIGSHRGCPCHKEKV